MPEFLNDDHKLQYEATQNQIDFALTYIQDLQNNLTALGAATNLKECLTIKTAVTSLTDIANFRNTQLTDTLTKTYINIPNIQSISQAKPEEFLSTILGSIEDTGSSQYSNLSGFITDLAQLPPGDAVKNLAMKELIDSGWSLTVDLNGDGKTAQLVKGSDIVEFLTAAFNGDLITSDEILLGVVTKFEKEIFGFSLIEVGKEVDKLAKILSNGNPIADIMSGNLLNVVDNVLEKIGGNNEYVKKIRGIIRIAKGLIDAWNKAKTDLNKALEIFNKQKAIVVSGGEWTFEDIEAVTTTTLAPGATTPGETTLSPGTTYGQTTLPPTTTVPPVQPPIHTDPPYKNPPGNSDDEIPEELLDNPFEDLGTVYDDEI